MELIQDLMDQLEILFRLFSTKGLLYLGDNFTFPDIRVLDYLSETGKCNMTEIVNNLKLAASTATGIVDRLVKKNYVKRQHSKKDRRKVLLEITSLGREMQKKIRSESLIKLGALLKEFTPEEITQLVKLMQKINEKTYSVIESK